MCERGGDLTGHREAHGSLQRGVLFAHLVQDRVALSRQSTQKQGRDAEREQWELDVEQRNGARCQLECRNQRGLHERHAEHCTRHPATQRDPGHRDKQRIKQTHIVCRR